MLPLADSAQRFFYANPNGGGFVVTSLSKPTMAGSVTYPKPVGILVWYCRRIPRRKHHLQQPGLQNKTDEQHTLASRHTDKKYPLLVGTTAVVASFAIWISAPAIRATCTVSRTVVRHTLYQKLVKTISFSLDSLWQDAPVLCSCNTAAIYLSVHLHDIT